MILFKHTVFECTAALQSTRLLHKWHEAEVESSTNDPEYKTNFTVVNGPKSGKQMHLCGQNSSNATNYVVNEQ